MPVSRSLWWKVAAIALVIVAAAGAAWLRGNDAAQDPGGTGGLPRLLEFSGEWCQPCKTMKPIIEALQRDYAGRVSVEFVDVDKNPDLAQQYGIRVIPTQVFIDSAGREVSRHEGVFEREAIEALFRTHFGLGAG